MSWQEWFAATTYRISNFLAIRLNSFARSRPFRPISSPLQSGRKLLCICLLPNNVKAPKVRLPHLGGLFVSCRLVIFRLALLFNSPRNTQSKYMVPVRLLIGRHYSPQLTDPSNQDALNLILFYVRPEEHRIQLRLSAVAGCICVL